MEGQLQKVERHIQTDRVLHKFDIESGPGNKREKA